MATVALAVFAIVTASYARRAFLKQSQEVRAIEQQVQDAQELTRISAPVLRPLGSGEFEVELASVPPGDGSVGGQVGVAEDG